MHDMKTAQADDMIFKNKNATLRQEDPDPRSGLSSVRAHSYIHDIYYLSDTDTIRFHDNYFNVVRQLSHQQLR